jgi:precorrin-6B methylase 2
MLSKIIEKLLSWTQNILFENIGTKFHTNSLKNLMDRLFIFYEKISNKFSIISNNYLKMYQEIVEKEIKMANISSNDTVLIIGCGSLPATSILIAMKTNAKIVSIDKDHGAIKEASQYVKNIGFQKQIKFEQANGLYYPIRKFSVILVLYGVKQIKEILKYLVNNMNDKTRIIFRTITDENGKALGGKIDLSSTFLIKDKSRSRTIGPVDSFLLMKKNTY